MRVCDRCGNKVIQRDVSKNTRLVAIYQRAAAYMFNTVDLCDDCLNKLDDCKNKAESYFMVNKENPSEIFDTVKYWRD